MAHNGGDKAGYHGNHNGARPSAPAKKTGGAWAGTQQRKTPDARSSGRDNERDPKRRYQNVPRATQTDAPDNREDLCEARDNDYDGARATAGENLLVGRNPIREALKGGQPIEKLLVMRGDLSGSARAIVNMARDAGVVVTEVDKSRLDDVYLNHQGMIAYASAAEYSTLDDILALAKDRGEDAFIILLDGVTDPHNLGAIIRSAECAGAHGVVIPERRSAGLNPACVKAAAGALTYIKVAKVTNLCRAAESLKRQGIWLYAADMDGESVYETDLSGPVALVVGSEGEGVSRLMLSKCDRTVRIPLCGHISSLNASVAAGILLFETARARRKHASEPLI